VIQSGEIVVIEVAEFGRPEELLLVEKIRALDAARVSKKVSAKVEPFLPTGAPPLLGKSKIFVLCSMSSAA